jgi:iron complex transport system ATP-binding protein
MRTLSGFQPALKGAVYIEGKSIEEYTPRELSERVGVVLTERNTTPDLTVEEVVSIGRMPYTNFWGKLTQVDYNAVDEAIELVGIESLRHKKIGRVSDGERQKVMIAKALAEQTGIILLDEPTAFLDYGSKVSVMRLLRRLAHEQGKSILLSTHDLEIAFQTTDEVWILQHDGLLTGTLDALEQRGIVTSFLAKGGLHYDAEHKQIVIDAER